MKPLAFLPLVSYPGANSEAIAANAVAIATQLGAGLHALAVNVDIPPVSSVLSKFLLDVPAMIEEAEAASRKRGEQLLAAVEKQAAIADISATTGRTTSALSLMGDSAAMHARYFDITVVGWETGNATSRMTAEAVIFGSGRPTVLLPELTSTGSLDHVAVAWDGSRVAARAVADARPFLERASRISVLTVLDEKPLKEQDAGERLASGLRKRGTRGRGSADQRRGLSDRRHPSGAGHRTGLQPAGNGWLWAFEVAGLRAWRGNRRCTERPSPANSHVALSDNNVGTLPTKMRSVKCRR